MIDAMDIRSDRKTLPQISLIPQKLGITASVEFVQSVAAFCYFAAHLRANARPHT
jgi:hypothetical protein